MKIVRTTTKTLMGAGNKALQRRKPRFDSPEMPVFPPETNQGLIQWPTEKQILEVSRQLSKINRLGIRSEASGDYFNSGELAYQMQEIIRATAELLKKGRRIRGHSKLTDRDLVP